MNRGRIASVRVLIVACLLSIAVAVILDAAGVKQWRAQAGAAVAAAVATVSGSVLKEWLTATLTRRATAEEDHAKRIFMPAGRLPYVREITDPISVGVRPAPPRSLGGRALEGRGDRVPDYVRRDVDTELAAALSAGGFVLLVGDATAGKTRTAYEAMRAVLPDHHFIAPSELEDAAAAVQAAATRHKCVLWLDNLQVFLGPGGLTRKAIAELMNGTGNQRVILATMRAADESRLSARNEAEDEQFMRIGQSVIEQAHRRIFVERLFNSSELTRAEELAYHDSRLADAISHSAHCGIGEYLACGPQLFADWQGAWSRENHPRGAALIAAAVDCRRAGFTSPLPRSLLDELHTVYLEQHSGNQLYSETLAQAWEWAVKPRESGSAPLRYIDRAHCDVFDYLIDEFRRREGENCPPATAQLALSYAGPDDASMIAVTAWRQGRYELAETAIQKVYDAVRQVSGPDDPDTLAVRNNLAVVLHAQRRLAEAEAEYRAILEVLVNVLGPDRPRTLAVRNNIAVILHSRGQLTAAESEYRAILRVRTATLGARHPETLGVRNNLAVALHAQGRLREAEAEYRSTLLARAEVLGPDHPSTLTTRNNHAVVLASLDRLDEAEAEYRDVLAARVRVLGADHPHTKISRDNLASLMRKRSAG